MCRYVRISTTIYIRKRFFSRKPLRIAAHHDNILNAVRMSLKIPLGRFLRGTFFFRLWGIFCVQVSYCPAKGGNRAGSSMNEFDYSRRGTQTIFSLLDCRSNCCENFGQAHFSVFLPEKKVDQTESQYLPIVSFLTIQLKMSQSKILATATLKKEAEN